MVLVSVAPQMVISFEDHIGTLKSCHFLVFQRREYFLDQSLYIKTLPGGPGLTLLYDFANFYVKLYMFLAPVVTASPASGQRNSLDGKPPQGNEGKALMGDASDFTTLPSTTVQTEATTVEFCKYRNAFDMNRHPGRTSKFYGSLI